MAGTKTFSTMKSALKLNLGERDDVDTANYLGTWINDAYLDLTSRFEFWTKSGSLKFNFPELDSIYTTNTTDGTAYISKPSSCLIVTSAWDKTNDKRLYYKPWRWYIEQTDREDTTAEDKPEYWTPYGLYLYLYPTPDATYQIKEYYRRQITLLSAASDVTEISQEWDEVIIQMATIKGLMHLREYDKAKFEKDELVEMIVSKLRLQDIGARDQKEYIKPSYTYKDFDY